MHDFYIAASCGYIVILLANLYLSIDILLKIDSSQEGFKERMIRVLALGVALFSFSSLINASGTLLRDIDLITGWEQNKLQMLARMFGIAASCVFFSTLSLGFEHKKKIAIGMGALSFGLGVYFFKVFY